MSRGIGTSLLGDVVLRVSGQTLAIESDWGGGEIACIGGSDVQVRVTAKSFCQMIRSRKQGELKGTMSLIFRPGLKEVAIDRVGVRAKFV